jgi:hypothetical protein
MVAQLPQLEKLLIDGLTPYPKPASLLLLIKRVPTFVEHPEPVGFTSPQK